MLESTSGRPTDLEGILVHEHDSVSAMSGETLPFPLASITLPALIGCFLFWLDFYLILMIFNPKKSAEWNCRVVTFFHGGFSAFLSFLCSFWIGPWPFSYLGKPCTNLHLAIVLISLGYFLFDLFWCVWSKSEGPVMLAHHVVSISGFVLVLVTGEYGAELVAVLGGSEVTNPILQGRWFLKQMGLYKGRIEVAVDWLFLVGFGVMRIGLGTPLFLCFQLTPDIILPARMGSLAMYVISIVFFVQLVVFICRKYFIINEKDKKL